MIFGDGSQTRDFVYVDDVVDAFVRAAEKGGGLTMNIGTSVETSVQQLYDLMAKLTGFREPPRYEPARAGELQRSAVDPGKAEIHLGWKPFTSLEEGLARTLEHFKAQRAGRDRRRSREAADLVERHRRPGAADVRRDRGGRRARARAATTRPGAPSASRASSGQKIGAATQHDARPRSVAVSIRFSTAAPSESSAMPHSARWRRSSG